MGALACIAMDCGGSWRGNTGLRVKRDWSRIICRLGVCLHRCIWTVGAVDANAVLRVDRGADRNFYWSGAGCVGL